MQLDKIRLRRSDRFRNHSIDGIHQQYHNAHTSSEPIRYHSRVIRSQMPGRAGVKHKACEIRACGRNGICIIGTRQPADFDQHRHEPPLMVVAIHEHKRSCLSGYMLIVTFRRV
jgi:hypothetical protein